jgi:CheY-like chemotaxis protein
MYRKSGSRTLADAFHSGPEGGARLLTMGTYEGRASERKDVMGKQTILVVEDEVMIRMLMSDVLRDEGYLVIEAANGDEGKDLLLSGHGIDLIVTDVRMPGQTDGVQLAALAKSLEPSRPVVVVSGHLPPAAANSADEFIPKPYLPSTFLQVIVKLIGPPCQPPHDRTG